MTPSVPRPTARGGAPLPPDELDRLKALCAYDLLDTAPEPEYDDLTALAAQVCETPMAAVSILDVGRQWFKARVGLAAQETRRDVSFCAWAVLDRLQPLVVPDARHDERFAANPLVVGEPGLRFYAGVPLVTSDDQALGALCVLDTRARELSPPALQALSTLARQVVSQFELRRALLEADGLRRRLSRWEDAAGPGRRNRAAT